MIKFKQSQEWKDFYYALENTESNILIKALSGVGKTYGIYKYYRDKQRRFGSVNMTQNTTKEDIFGHLSVNDTGGMHGIHNQGLWCAENGYPIVVNEIDHTSVNGDARSALQTLAETRQSWRYVLQDGTNKEITPKPGFRVIATMNGEFTDIEMALLTRFPIKLDLGNAVDPLAIESLPKHLHGLIKKIPVDNATFNLRSLFEFAECLKKGTEPHQAARLYFGQSNDHHSIADAILIELSRTVLDLEVSDPGAVEAAKKEAEEAKAKEAEEAENDAA